MEQQGYLSADPDAGLEEAQVARSSEQAVEDNESQTVDQRGRLEDGEAILDADPFLTNYHPQMILQNAKKEDLIVPESSTVEAITTSSTLFPPFSKRVRLSTTTTELPASSDEETSNPPVVSTTTKKSEGTSLSAGQVRITSYKQRIEAMKEKARQRELSQQQASSKTDKEPAADQTEDETTTTTTTTTTARSTTSRPRIPPRMPSRKPIQPSKASSTTDDSSPDTSADELPSNNNKRQQRPKTEVPVVGKIPPSPFERRRAQQAEEAAAKLVKEGPFQKIKDGGGKRRVVGRRTTTAPPLEDSTELPQEEDEQPRIELVEVIPQPEAPSQVLLEERQSVNEEAPSEAHRQDYFTQHEPILPIEELLNIRVRDNGKGM